LFLENKKNQNFLSILISLSQLSNVDWCINSFKDTLRINKYSTTTQNIFSGVTLEQNDSKTLLPNAQKYLRNQIKVSNFFQNQLRNPVRARFHNQNTFLKLHKRENALENNLKKCGIKRISNQKLS
jgi:hypothetical protein